MFLQRIVFKAKYGKSLDVVEVIKRFEPLAKRYGFPLGRVYTDVVGRFDTVVWEAEFEDLNQLEEASQRGFQDPEFARWFEMLQPMIDHGYRELFRLEHHW